LDMATGDWIQFLDADDILPPEKIAVQLARLDNSPEGSMGFCPWSYFHNDGRIDPLDSRQFWSDHENGLSLLINMWHEGGFFPPHVWLTPRKLIDKAGQWNEKLTGDDDGEFFGRLLISASEVRFCEDTCAYYRDPPAGSVSRDKSLRSALSFFTAFEVVANQVLTARSDKMARKACLSRVRKTAYAWRDVPEVLNQAAAFEKKLSLFDFSPALPLGTRYLVAVFGLKRGLQIRRLLQS
jgi:glycosyltransferase involved in cell wall biosynthesis